MSDNEDCQDIIEVYDIVSFSANIAVALCSVGTFIALFVFKRKRETFVIYLLTLLVISGLLCAANGFIDLFRFNEEGFG